MDGTAPTTTTDATKQDREVGIIAQAREDVRRLPVAAFPAVLARVRHELQGAGRTHAEATADLKVLHPLLAERKVSFLLEEPDALDLAAANEPLERLRVAAAPALDHPRPLELFEQSCRSMGLGGNLVLATTAYLAATTRVLGRGRKLQAHTFVLGPASSGKSYELDAALEHLPHDAVVRFDGCSPRALIYSRDDIRNRVLVYSEMDSLPTGDTESGDAMNTALTFLRTLVADGVATYDVTIKAKDGFETRRYTKEGPATLIVTGTKRIPDEQLASRLHEVEVTVDRARLQSVMAAQGRLIQGGTSSPADPAIVAAQAYLQALAPLEVLIPFGDVLGQAILSKANTTDPRLTREFLRVAGFTAAHALLSIERRQRTDAGHIVATLEDYEAAASVIRELSTLRQFSKFAIETWVMVNNIYNETHHQAVGVAAVAKKMLKAHSHVRTTMNNLIQGGALIDARERPGRTAPLLVMPSTDSPIRMALPTGEELVEGGASPAATISKREQPEAGQRDNSLKQAHGSLKQVTLLKDLDLAPLADDSGGGSSTAIPDMTVCDSTYTYNGTVYRVGDVLPDGRRFIEPGPIFSKRPGAGGRP